MNISCVICREQLLLADDVYSTLCGHVFHFPCLNQWLERSKTCPQCREKVTQGKTHRVYFNASCNDTIIDDPSTLQTRVESLEFKLMLRDKDVNHYKSKAITADKQVSGLRKETMRLENEIALKNSANYALNEQLKLLCENSKIMEDQRKEIEKLKRHIELSCNVNTLINSSYDAVDEMIKESRDPQTFITYIKVLKQELSASTNKRKDQRTMIKNLHQDIFSLTKERNLMSEELVKKKNLELALAKSESNRMELEKKLKALESNEQIPERKTESLSEATTPVTSEIPPKESLRRPYEGSDDTPVAVKKAKPSLKPQYLLGSPIVISEDSSDEGGNVNLTCESKENEKSPYLRVKSKGISALKELHSQRSTVGSSHSIFGKRRLPTTSQKGFGPSSFDGLGGHSRPELFPICAKQKKTTSQEAVKAKKPKLDDGNKKLGDFLINLV